MQPQPSLPNNSGSPLDSRLDDDTIPQARLTVEGLFRGKGNHPRPDGSNRGGLALDVVVGQIGPGVLAGEGDDLARARRFIGKPARGYEGHFIPDNQARLEDGSDVQLNRLLAIIHLVQRLYAAYRESLGQDGGEPGGLAGNEVVSDVRSTVLIG